MRISPSQIKTYHEICPRRWWYERHRPRVPQPSAEFGDRTHALLEHWLQRGITPEQSAPPEQALEAATATSGLGLIPPPAHAEVEIRFAFAFGGATYSGRVDFAAYYARGAYVLIGDHKTIGDLRHAKTEDDLLEDPQRIIYSYWAAQRYRVETVGARWVYYQRATPRRKARARAVEFAERSDMIAERMEDLHKRRSLPIVQARRDDLGPGALPRNLSSCSLFPPHGCPYREECHAGIDPMDALHAAIFLAA